MADPFIGEIRSFGFNFAPKGWASCDGRLLAIAQNTALFSILGTTYGGDGVQTFALPDLRGRAPLQVGAAVVQGQSGGAETVTLATSQLPAHSHGVFASADLATGVTPAGELLGGKPRFGADIYTAAANLTPLAPGAVDSAGSSQAHDNMQPSLVVNYCIALLGIFPSRN